MKNLLLVILALSLVFGCVQETAPVQNNRDAQAMTNESAPVENSTAATLPTDEVEKGTATATQPAGEVELEVEFTMIDLTTSTMEVRKPNPECYPDAQKCGMMDEPMHIFENEEHTYYNLSSKGDACLIAPGGDASSTDLYLVKYKIENKDSAMHSVNPELLVKTENPKMGYLVSSPYSKTNCTSFYDDSVLRIELDPGESLDFKAVMIIPKTETPLTASVFADGEE